MLLTRDLIANPPTAPADVELAKTGVSRDEYCLSEVKSWCLPKGNVTICFEFVRAWNHLTIIRLKNFRKVTV